MQLAAWLGQEALCTHCNPSHPLTGPVRQAITAVNRYTRSAYGTSTHQCTVTGPDRQNCWARWRRRSQSWSRSGRGRPRRRWGCWTRVRTRSAPCRTRWCAPASAWCHGTVAACHKHTVTRHARLGACLARAYRRRQPCIDTCKEWHRKYRRGWVRGDFCQHFCNCCV